MIKYLVPSEAAFSMLHPWPSDSVLSPSPCSGINTNTDALVSIRHWLWPQDPRGQMLRLTSVSPALSRSVAYSWHFEGLFWKFPWLCWAHSGDESPLVSWVDQYVGSVIKIMLSLFSYLCPLFPQVWSVCLLHAAPVRGSARSSDNRNLPALAKLPDMRGVDTWGRPTRRQERLPREVILEWALKDKDR